MVLAWLAGDNITIGVGKNFRGHQIPQRHFTGEESVLSFLKVKQQAGAWPEIGSPGF